MIGNKLRRAVALAAALLLIAAFSLTAGCANQTIKTNQEGSQGANQGAPSPQPYSHDGFLGNSNINPHVQGRSMSVSDAEAAKAMQQAISGMRGVKGANIAFNGPEAFVSLKIDPNVDAKQVPTIEREAATVLRFNFPRYSIHVRSMQ